MQCVAGPTGHRDSTTAMRHGRWRANPGSGHRPARVVVRLLGGRRAWEPSLAFRAHLVRVERRARQPRGATRQRRRQRYKLDAVHSGHLVEQRHTAMRVVALGRAQLPGQLGSGHPSHSPNRANSKVAAVSSSVSTQQLSTCGSRTVDPLALVTRRLQNPAAPPWDLARDGDRPLAPAASGS